MVMNIDTYMKIRVELLTHKGTINELGEPKENKNSQRKPMAGL
jgi:hypothetical protein